MRQTGWAEMPLCKCQTSWHLLMFARPSASDLIRQPNTDKGVHNTKGHQQQQQTGHTRSPIITPIEVTLLPHSLHDLKPNVIVDRQVIAQWERRRWERKSPRSGCAVLMRSQINEESLCHFNKTLLPIWLEVEAETIMYWKYICNIFRKRKSN